MNLQIAVTLIFGALLLAGIGLMAVVLRGRQRMQELAMEERIAMIERGLVPSPEADPAGFERLLHDRRPPNRAALRFQSVGVMFMGLGFALGILLAFVARQPSLALGLGGAIAVLGLTASLNGILMASNPRTPEPPRS